MSTSSIPHDESSSEQWRDIPGYEGLYQISDLGSVKSLPAPGKGRKNTGRILKPAHVAGYFYVNLCKNGSKRFSIHALVALVFIGERPQDYDVNHKNGDKTDNRLINLEYVTRSDNIQHSFHVLKRHPVGESHPNSKLTEADIRSIREALGRGESGYSLAKLYNVDPMTISDIKHRKWWKHV